MARDSILIFEHQVKKKIVAHETKRIYFLFFLFENKIKETKIGETEVKTISQERMML
jgi:hypothetical protein